ncbi:unnamed protein product [Cylindrotheca closterium]|uniref:Uncharacterized protein n=1 Tax=Cylindrotheca closterium TaxID=2856 RepID=A0AAD2CVQ1_9STRA|nr:unnamed protein product [Cylindrotheca closterium]
MNKSNLANVFQSKLWATRAPTKTEVDLEFANTIRDWCYSFTSSIESAKEEKDSWNALLTFVDNMDKEGNPTKDLIRFTRKYLTTFFNKSMEYLSFRHYMAVPNGDRADNCSSVLTKVQNQATRFMFQRWKLAQRDIAYVNNLTVQSIKCLVSTSTRSQQTNTSVQDANLQELTMHIIKSKESLAVEQHCLGSNCYIYYPGLSNSKEQTFYVRENLIRASVTRFTSWRPAVPRTRVYILVVFSNVPA